MWIEAAREQCSFDSDCTKRGAAYAKSQCIDAVCVDDPAWSCLGSVAWPEPTESRQVTVTVRFRDVVTGEPLTTVRLNICRKQDFACVDPLMRGIGPLENGDLSFKVDAGFDGYLEMSAPGRVPALFFFYPPVTEDREVAGLPLLPPALLDQVSQLAGKPMIPERGVALLGASDCRSVPAEGVHIWSSDADVSTSAFYVIKKIPSATATFTDASGEGGFLNLRAGSAAIIGTLADGRRIGTVTVLVRAGTITYTTMIPTPN